MSGIGDETKDTIISKRQLHNKSDLVEVKSKVRQLRTRRVDSVNHLFLGSPGLFLRNLYPLGLVIIS